MIKRIISTIVMLCLVFSLVACNDDPKKEINLETKVESQEKQKTNDAILNKNEIANNEIEEIEVTRDKPSADGLTSSNEGTVSTKIEDNSKQEEPNTIQQEVTSTKISSHYVSKDLLNKSAEYVYVKVQTPSVGSIGGEWAVIGLKQSEYDVSSNYFDNYYQVVCDYTKSKEGVLHAKKYTDYSRVILALSLIGKEASDVEGYNLVEPLNDFNQTVWQGNNGAIWALIAIDAINIECSQREAYIKHIFNAQMDNGAWGITNTLEDLDMTAMALTALSTYSNRQNVKNAIDKGFAYLEEKYSSNAITFSESYSQCIVAYSSNNRSLPDGMYNSFISFKLNDGSFEHTKGDGSNQMASEQALYALTALYRAENGMSKLFVSN